MQSLLTRAAAQASAKAAASSTAAGTRAASTAAFAARPAQKASHGKGLSHTARSFQAQAAAVDTPPTLPVAAPPSM